MDELLSNVLVGVPDVMSSFRQPNKWQYKNNAKSPAASMSCWFLNF